MPHSRNGVYPNKYQVLSEDGERVFCRAWRLGDGGDSGSPRSSFCLPRSTRRAQASIVSPTNSD